jgi:hypothetical protein
MPQISHAIILLIDLLLVLVALALGLSQFVLVELLHVVELELVVVGIELELDELILVIGVQTIELSGVVGGVPLKLLGEVLDLVLEVDGVGVVAKSGILKGYYM